MVGVVGLGAMGSRIAARLLETGHQVAVWNRTAEKAAPIVALGAELAATPAELAASSRVVITMVSDPAALQATVSGPAGIAAGLAPGADVVEMSTVGPPAIQWLRSQLPAGVGLVDAPVLGSVAQAERGELTLYAGGSDESVGRVTPVLTALGTIVRVGESGSGAAAKLVANAALFAAVAAVGEAIAFARSVGLDDEVVDRVLETTPLGAEAARRRPLLAAGDYPPRFSLALAAKDARLILEAASASDAGPLRLIEGVQEWLAQAEQEGWGGNDYTAMLATITTSRPPESSPTMAARLQPGQGAAPPS
jgi:3-hydroxyisobutyrate dehydrogenase-like beta-hydroxyacid dehydrogenase